MLTTVLELLFAFAAGLLGAAAASWLWYSHICRQAAGASHRHSSPAADAAVRLHKMAAQVAVDFTVRLHELAAQVAFDVGEHSSQVEKINEDLTSSKSHDPTKILDMVMKLVEANHQMQNKLASTKQKLRAQTDQMQTLLVESRTDALTLLANRRAFDDELAKRFAEFRRHNRPFSLTVVDVDRFKNVNDTYGHQTGDEVLRIVAELLRREFRETDLVARYGGEEFAIIHPSTSLTDACKSAQRVCEAIEMHQFAIDGKNPRVTVSLGVAEVLGNENAVEVFKRADSAMYASKKAGRNCVHFQDGEVFRRVVTYQEAVHPSANPPPPSKPVPYWCKEDEPASPAQEANGKSQSEGLAEPETLLDIPGRTRFCQQVRKRMAEWNRGGPAFSLALIEVSHYDEGGENSDQQARELASRVTARFLVATIREMDVLGSYAPGCFALMMPTVGLADAIRVADRLLEVLLRHIFLAFGEQPTFSLSVGVVQAIESDDATSVLKRAEIALDAAGRGRGNRVYCHDGKRVVPIAVILEMEATGCRS